MAFVVTIRDVVPPVRADTLPWTVMETQESADGSTNWATIDTWTFPDPDTDPANPKLRTRTIETATLERGFYRVRFSDATADVSSWSEPMENAALPTWAPAVREIASLMRARTKDRNSQELGMFTTETRPTAEEVEEEIENQAGWVAMLVGFAPTSSTIRTAAKNLTKLRTAMALESSYYPEQIENGHSPYRAWQDQYRIDMQSLNKIIFPEGDVDPPSDDPLHGMPSYNFPSKNNLVGWRTPF